MLEMGIIEESRRSLIHLHSDTSGHSSENVLISGLAAQKFGSARQHPWQKNIIEATITKDRSCHTAYRSWEELGVSKWLECTNHPHHKEGWFSMAVCGLQEAQQHVPV